MLKKSLIFVVTNFCIILSTKGTLSADKLEKYKQYLEAGTYMGACFSENDTLPKSRYDTFKLAFEHFEVHEGKVIVELGTSRSFTHGGHIGCNRDETHFWTPNNPENWDWGAGFFTRMAATCLEHLHPIIHTIDLAAAHIARCKVMTKEFSHFIRYYVCSSVDFLQRCQSQSIDLLYLDTGDMTPIEPTALLQLAEAKIIVEKNLLTTNGILLIDDVKNQTPKKFGDTSGLGKSKYAIPYLLNHGFEMVANEYQVILKRK